jgi:hypothetical protein
MALTSSKVVMVAEEFETNEVGFDIREVQSECTEALSLSGEHEGD